MVILLRFSFQPKQGETDTVNGRIHWGLLLFSESFSNNTKNIEAVCCLKQHITSVSITADLWIGKGDVLENG